MQYAVSIKKTQNVFRITKLRSWELNVLHLCNSDFTRANIKLRQLRPFERKEQRCNWSGVALSEIQIISTIFHLLLSAITSKLIIFSWLNILHFWWLRHAFYLAYYYFLIRFCCKINVCIDRWFCNKFYFYYSRALFKTQSVFGFPFCNSILS